ncbi:hypothetical protein ACU6VJ_10780 [Sphaerotilus sulfidivorans]
MAAALGISKTTVSDIAMYARDAGVDWALASTLLLPEGLPVLGIDDRVQALAEAGSPGPAVWGRPSH